jgi:hypothetical protein
MIPSARDFDRLGQPKMILFWKWTIVALFVVLLAAFLALCKMTGGPRDVYGMVRYALPHMRRGNLKIGDEAPDARLLALDGSDHFHIRERTGSRPLVVIFGSYT